jgi:hypothetical protein
VVVVVVYHYLFCRVDPDVSVFFVVILVLDYLPIAVKSVYYGW